MIQGFKAKLSGINYRTIKDVKSTRILILSLTPRCDNIWYLTLKTKIVFKVSNS